MTDPAPAEASVTVRVRDVHVSYEAVTDEGAGVKGLLARKQRRYQRIHAVKGVSFDLHEGESLGIIGSNGSGKSTLLAALTGLLPVESGEIAVRSRPTLLGVGAVMRPQLSGRRNIAIGGLALGWSLEQVREQMESIIDFSGLREAIDLPMRTYSSGMRARLMFAVATSSIPEILLIDEALAVGDAEFADRSQQRIDTIRARAGSVVLVSHNQSEIRSTCDRVLWLDRGELIADGDPDEVLAAYEERVQARVAERLPSADGSDRTADAPTVTRASRGSAAVDRTLTIHVGSNFTTLPVQRFLADQERTLAAAGTSIPSFLGLRSHYPFGAAAFERTAALLSTDMPGGWRDWRDQFVTDAREQMDNGNDWIISSEQIGSIMGPKAITALRRLVDELGFEHGRIVYFVQRQDRLAARTHISDVLAGFTRPFSIEAEVDNDRRHDWRRIHEWWAGPDAFDDVVVRLYPDRPGMGDIVSAFADAAGLAPVDGTPYLGEPLLSAEAIDFVQRLVHPDATEPANRATVASAARAIATTGLEPFRLTASESRKLHQAFAEPNAWILDRVDPAHRVDDYFAPDSSSPDVRPVADRDQLIEFAGRIARRGVG